MPPSMAARSCDSPDATGWPPLLQLASTPRLQPLLSIFLAGNRGRRGWRSSHRSWRRGRRRGYSERELHAAMPQVCLAMAAESAQLPLIWISGDRPEEPWRDGERRWGSCERRDRNKGETAVINRTARTKFCAIGRLAGVRTFLPDNRFIVTFTNRAPDPERDSAAVQEFLENMEGAFRSHTPCAGSSEEELESAGEGLEKYVMTKLFNRVFASVPEDVKSDEELSEKMSLLQQFIRPENLDIKPEYQNETSWLLAQKELQKMNMYKAPRDKLACILNCCKVINNLLMNASQMSNDNAPGADEFLPVLIYVTLKANPPQLHSNLLYIQRYRCQSRLVSEAQYFFTNILSAESFIWNIDAESLSMDERDFQKKMDLARERLLGLSAGSENQDNETNLDVREHRSETLKGSGSSDVNLSLKDHGQGPVQDKRRESDVSSKSVERVQSISDLEKKGATELLKDDDLNKIFQEYPFLFALAGDLTVADIDTLLNSYKQLILRYVALSHGMGVTPETPFIQSTQTAPDLQISEEPENVKNVVNSSESGEESSKISEDIKKEISDSEVGNVARQQAAIDPSDDQNTLKDESADQSEHA